MAAPLKRKLGDLDPDYEDVDENQKKRQKLIEATGKEATISKIESILQVQFSETIRDKDIQINVINQRLSEAQRMLDRLRACIVSSYYSMDEPGLVDYQNPAAPVPIHPTVKKPLAKRPKENPYLNVNGDRPSSAPNPASLSDPENTLIGTLGSKSSTDANRRSTKQMSSGRTKDGSTKHKITVGNISRYIPIAKREDNDPSTHKWMVYVRGPKEKGDLSHIVKEVWFFLHPSYRPNDLVIVKESPFHLTRRGWGEFPVRTQLHFHDTRNKNVDVVHHLKLDRTYTGLQTLGSETVVEVELESDKKTMATESVSRPVAAHSGLLNGVGGIVIKTEPGTSRSATPTSLLSPSRIKKEPESPYATPIPMHVQVKQEPLDSPAGTPHASPNVKLKGGGTPKKTDAGWIQFQICGENVKSTVTSPSPLPPRMGSPNPGWTKITDLSASEESSGVTKAAAPPRSAGTPTGKLVSLTKGSPSGKLGTGRSSSPAVLTGSQQTQLKIVGPSLTVTNSSVNTLTTPTSSAAAQLLYVKCIDKSGVALLASKQVTNNSGTVPRSGSDILLKVTPPRSSKPPEASSISTTSASTAAAKNAVTLAALPKNATYVYCSSKVSPQTGSASAAKKSAAAAGSPANVALAKPGQYFIQYPASVLSNANSTSLLRPRLPATSPVLQSVSVPTARPGGQGTVQNVILTTKPGTGKPALQSILTPPTAGNSGKDPKKPTIAIVMTSPTYMLGKASVLDKRAAIDSRTTITSAQPHAINSLLVKQPQQGKTISLLRPGLLQTKAVGGGTPRAVTSSGNPLPMSLAPGQIALIASPTSSAGGTVVHQAVQISQAGNGIKAKTDQTGHPSNKPQSSYLYIVPTSSAAPKQTPSHEITSRPSTIPSHSILGPIKKPQTSQYSPADLLPKFESFGIAKFVMSDMKTMEELVRYTIKLFPLVAQKPDRHAFPYCAPGYAEFFKWSLPKQRAAEWTRACAVRKVMTYLMVKHKCGDTFQGEKLWSRREIVLWCRKNRFTPMGSTPSFPNRASRYGSSPKRLKSVTDHRGLVSKVEDLKDDVAPTEVDSDVEDIDIISESIAPKPIDKVVKQEPKSQQPEKASENPNPNSVGDMLMRVTQNFVEDLIRGASSNMYDEEFPSVEIGAIDIYNFLKMGNAFDFLTNNHMGIDVD